MPSCVIECIASRDARFALPPGAGTDAVHSNPEYCFAVTRLKSSRNSCGTGIALTLGEGNRLVCEAIDLLARPLAGLEIEELMADFGAMSRRIADDPSLRWLGPHKGVVHLALASITNACFDLWAKSRGLPLWKVLLDLTPEQTIALLDLTYVEDVMSKEEATALLRDNIPTRSSREPILRSGYPGYDTSVGWMGYDDSRVRDLLDRAVSQGFRAFKLKVGSPDEKRDLRRAELLRRQVGDDCMVMFDANQSWGLHDAIRMGHALGQFKPLWLEEPTHPDDIQAYVILAREIAPVKIAAGEHVPNRVMFKNFLQAGALSFVQADCTRLGGISEFLTVSLLAKQFGLPLPPHVGDMGQLHQHLVLFNHIAMGHEISFLEHIPHLREHFVFPAKVSGGRYATPSEPGASCDLTI
jgi:L-fuconate dehydratase